jgi:hypothetical protein
LAANQLLYDDETVLVQLEENQSKQLPPVGMPVIVQCDGYRCEAYRNAEGKWFSSHDGREVNGVINFSPLHRPRT